MTQAREYILKLTTMLSIPTRASVHDCGGLRNIQVVVDADGRGAGGQESGSGISLSRL